MNNPGKEDIWKDIRQSLLSGGSSYLGGAGSSGGGGGYTQSTDWEWPTTTIATDDNTLVLIDKEGRKVVVTADLLQDLSTLISMIKDLPDDHELKEYFTAQRAQEVLSQ